VKRTPARLELEDGTVFNGYSFGAVKSNCGEVRLLITTTTTTTTTAAAATTATAAAAAAA